MENEAAGQEKELVHDERKDLNHKDKPTNSQRIRNIAENHGRDVDLDRNETGKPQWPSGETAPETADCQAGQFRGIPILSEITLKTDVD